MVIKIIQVEQSKVLKMTCKQLLYFFFPVVSPLDLNNMISEAGSSKNIAPNHELYSFNKIHPFICKTIRGHRAIGPLCLTRF